MAKIVKRKKPCNKCGCWFNYESRNCVGCKKIKNAQRYAERLKSEGKEKNTARKDERIKGTLTYISQRACTNCGNRERYVSSAGCIKCHKHSSKKSWQRIKDSKRQDSSISNPNIQLLFNVHIDAVMFDCEDSEFAANLNESQFTQLLNKYLANAESWNYQRKNIKGEYIDSNYLNFLAATEKHNRSPANRRLQIDLLYSECNLFEVIKKAKYRFEPPEFKIFDPCEHTSNDVLAILNADKEFQSKKEQESREFYRKVLKTGESHPLYELAREFMK